MWSFKATSETPKSKVLIGSKRCNFDGFCIEGYVCFLGFLIGKQAMVRNSGSDDFGDWVDESGPRSKVKRRSLKFVSHVMKKEVMEIWRTEES